MTHHEWHEKGTHVRQERWNESSGCEYQRLQRSRARIKSLRLRWYSDQLHLLLTVAYMMLGVNVTVLQSALLLQMRVFWYCYHRLTRVCGTVHPTCIHCLKFLFCYSFLGYYCTIATSCAEGYRFKSRSWSRLSWVGIFVVFFSPGKNMAV
jgi:hypothetical protein